MVGYVNDRHASLRLLRQESGQVLVIALFVCVGLVMIAISVANVGMMVAEKIHLQDTVDASAYSAAVVEARYMNLSAYINRAMIANYNNMAFNTALWAVADADDHGMAVIVGLLYQVDKILFLFPLTTAFAQPLDQFIDGLAAIHSVFHRLNHYMNEIFAQDDEARDFNKFIEAFNVDILTMYQGLLYAALQSSRHEVQQDVAKRMDPDVLTTSVLGLGAEAVSYDELARAVDFVIRDTDARGFPFNQFNSSFERMMGTASNTDEHPLLLGAVAEASLDKFAAGRDRDGNLDGLRNFPNPAVGARNIIPGTGAIEWVLDAACETATLSLGDCNSDINMTLGALLRDGYENKDSETHVPFIARQRMREVNFFGMDFNISGVPGGGALSDLLGHKGHTSGEKNNDIGNVANSTFSFGEGVNFERAGQTIINQGICAAGLPFPTCGLNSMNIIEAATMLPISLDVPPLIVDDHWDGSYEDLEPVDTWEVFPPFEGYIPAGEYQTKIAADGAEEGVPKYDWLVDLDNVGFPLYHYPSANAALRPNGTSAGGNNNILTGPSIAVVGVKPVGKIKTLRLLGTGNPYSMSAVARAQVYYLRNSNRPDETPSLFNPHWVARLAPLDSGDTPILLKKGLPYVSSVGVPIQPTH